MRGAISAFLLAMLSLAAGETPRTDPHVSLVLITVRPDYETEVRLFADDTYQVVRTTPWEKNAVSARQALPRTFDRGTAKAHFEAASTFVAAEGARTTRLRVTGLPPIDRASLRFRFKTDTSLELDTTNDPKLPEPPADIQALLKTLLELHAVQTREAEKGQPEPYLSLSLGTGRSHSEVGVFLYQNDIFEGFKAESRGEPAVPLRQPLPKEFERGTAKAAFDTAIKHAVAHGSERQRFHVAGLPKRYAYLYFRLKADLFVEIDATHDPKLPEPPAEIQTLLKTLLALHAVYAKQLEAAPVPK